MTLPDNDVYEDFPAMISFEDFRFEKYSTHEDTVLRPQLEQAGYYGIMFRMGEYDSFGPLSRICICTDKDGYLHKFVYG